MSNNKFLGLLSNAYKQILFEQDIPTPPTGGGAEPPPTAPIPAAMPQPPQAPAQETADGVQKSQSGEEPLTPEAEALLTSLLAKSFFIDLMDDTEKYKTKNMQANLNDENAAEVELELVRRIKSEDPKILDIDESLFELSPAGARMFLDKVANGKVVEGLQIKPGRGKAFILNLILTTLLRHFELSEKVKIQEILEDIRDKTTEGDTLKEWQSRSDIIFNSEFSKYAKI